MTIPIARSDIHAHLTRADVDVLFGKGHTLTNIRNLTIPGQFACAETIEVEGPAGKIPGVVVVGPERPYTQVEISFTNGLTLGITPPLRESGDLEGTPGAVLRGPAGSLILARGVIAAKRHIHMHTSDAAQFGVRDRQIVKVRVPGERALVFENVIVRVSPNDALEMHIDFDEGFSACVSDFMQVELIV